MITVSYTRVTKLAAGEDYHGELLEGYYRFHLFKFTNPGKEITKISFSQCLGQSSFAVVSDAGTLSKRLSLERNQE
jgi:hypothetical protein